MPCAESTTEHPVLDGTGVYVVVANADTGGVHAVSLGIEYSPALVVFNWWSCADMESPSGTWPISGSGNRVSWEVPVNCQRSSIAPDGVKAIAGVFYVYAYGSGVFQVGPDTAAGEDSVRIADCQSQEIAIPPDHLGRIGFGTSLGYNPCLPGTPVASTTWGRVKSLN